LATTFAVGALRALGFPRRFRQLDTTFEQFLLVAAAIKPADLPVTREEA
jgi:hypothetical protein